MVIIIKQEAQIETALKNKFLFICDFFNITPTIINDSTSKIDKKNLNYIR